MRWLIRGALALLLLGVLLVPFRREALVGLSLLLLPESELIEAAPEAPDVRFFDDYFTVEAIDSHTFAIGEPRYPQQNYSYLILGEERAVLFDTGPGERDIAPIVASLTPLPVIAAPSHLHYDHVGNVFRFARVAVLDLPYLRERAPDGVLEPTLWESLAVLEGRERQPLRVTDWWPPASQVSLGGRDLLVLHAPGHTRDSMALYDAERRQLFTGDYINEGVLLAFLPGGSLDDYFRTARMLLDRIDPGAALLTGHRATPPGAPVMRVDDLSDLHETLRGIRDGTRAGSGLLPKSFRVNEGLTLLSDHPLLDPIR